ncbi:MAG: hypothetical protein ACXWBP_03720 [Limisphaerales bacterium]
MNQPEVSPAPTSEIENQNETSSRHRRGYIARLPKTLRDKVNTMLDDGSTYASIVAELEKSTTPPLPFPVNEDNVRTWKAGGYQDYLRRQDWKDTLGQRQEKFLDAAENEPVKLAHAATQMAATGICEHLDELSRPRDGGEADADKYSRITNSLSRLVRSITVLEDYRAKLGKPKKTEGLTKEQITEIHEAMRLL